ncbi:GNAT family N-acetyltransferase [Colwellia psychrerythraea]|uniref:BioF2-like acetyltransferase domain-containing protein n=1 Tax=Colwellia psychrerythraea TaxID=28229 RepID=A0A099L1R6_COLPS|nr:GNAT family N-acetyltransferase [Colwellia psychrerythraea]KGJ96791.1 hypothetical protein GAB14E_1667 [Colwellia psychrerythraea]
MHDNLGSKDHFNDNMAFYDSNWVDAWHCNLIDNSNWTKKLTKNVINDVDCKAFWAFGEQKVGPFRFISLAGNFFPFRGVHISKGCREAITAVSNELTSQVDYAFRAGPTLKDDKFNRELVVTLKNKGWIVLTTALGWNYIVNLPIDIDELISAKRKKKIRYYWKAINKVGSGEIIHFNDICADRWKGVFSDLSQIESKAWISQKGEPRFLGVNNQRYWNQLIQNTAFSKNLNIWVMFLDSKPVSYVTTMDTKTTRFVLSNSYIDEVKDFSTGKKLYLEMITNAIDNQMKNLDIGFGDSGYKQEWGAEKKSEVIDLFAFPPTIRGRLTRYIFEIKKNLIKIL